MTQPLETVRKDVYRRAFFIAPLIYEAKRVLTRSYLCGPINVSYLLPLTYQTDLCTTPPCAPKLLGALGFGATMLLLF